ncbi:hypothetical protein [Kineococcus glutinatus]|uniref:Uncharacterized protein n=1 Tax=Kineococcus glutinatus TaxID=1070872 RepID=A0ABP9HG13_9ACTN
MRTWGLRLLALVLSLSWLVLPGFGIIDLSVTWDPDWPVVLEAGWGLFFTVLVGVPFLVVATVPRRSGPALVQLTCATAVLGMAAAISLEAPLAVLTVVLAAEVAAVAVFRAAPPILPLRAAYDVPLLLVAALAAPAWLVHAWQMAGANRRELLSADITIGVDHYSVQAATALALVALPMLAGCWPRGRAFLGGSVAVVAFYLGLVSYAWTGADAGFSPAWSLIAMVWAAAVLALALRPRAHHTLTRSTSRRSAHPVS